MKKLLFLTTLTLLLLSSCRNYNALQKTTDYDYKYEAAKQAYAAGHYTRAYQLLDELILIMKGTANAEECLFMDAMCYYNIRDYETATLHFDRYYKSYPKGTYTELARFYSGKSSFLQSPDPRLDQTPTYTAINSLQDFLEFYPMSDKRAEVNDMIFNFTTTWETMWETARMEEATTRLVSSRQKTLSSPILTPTCVRTST